MFNGNRLTGLALLMMAIGAALAAEGVSQEGRDRDSRSTNPPPREAPGSERDRGADRERDEGRGNDAARDRGDGRDRDDGRDQPLPPEPRRGQIDNRANDEGTEEGLPHTQVAPPGARVAPPWERDNDWKLGVYAANTPTGVRITRVLPNSAAASVGLERDDVVVAVEGYQIGYVKNRVYSLGEELQRRADSRGRVTLLVQNRRNDELLNIDVRLDRRPNVRR